MMVGTSTRGDLMYVPAGYICIEKIGKSADCTGVRLPLVFPETWMELDELHKSLVPEDGMAENCMGPVVSLCSSLAVNPLVQLAKSVEDDALQEKGQKAETAELEAKRREDERKGLEEEASPASVSASAVPAQQTQQTELQSEQRAEF
eukprot:1062831-Amphidinium_carterae.1